MGSRNADPIAPRRAFGEKGLDVFIVVITPVTPAASDVRRIAPTFTGLLMLCMMIRKGAAGCFAVKFFLSFAGCFARTTMPCGVLVKEIEARSFSLTAAILVEGFPIFSSSRAA